MRFGPTSTPFLAGIARRHDSGGRVGLDVRFGSKADICGAQAHVRFTPNSDIVCVFRQVCFGPKADSCIAAKSIGIRSRDRIIAMGTVYRHLYQAHTLEYDCARCSRDNELHAKSSATRMFFTVSVLKCLPSAAMNVPKEPRSF